MLFYLVFSSDIIFIFQSGMGVVIGFLAFGIAIGTKKHFNQVFKKVEHLGNVRLYFDEEVVKTDK
jgi:hypothetical protein